MVAVTYLCYVCDSQIFPAEDGWPHTHHAEACPLRAQVPCETVRLACAGLPGCGEDVHESCCLTCAGQA